MTEFYPDNSGELEERWPQLKPINGHKLNTRNISQMLISRGCIMTPSGKLGGTGFSCIGFSNDDIPFPDLVNLELFILS